MRLRCCRKCLFGCFLFDRYKKIRSSNTRESKKNYMFRKRTRLIAEMNRWPLLWHWALLIYQQGKCPSGKCPEVHWQPNPRGGPASKDVPAPPEKARPYSGFFSWSLQPWSETLGETLAAAVAEQWDQSPSETRWPEAKESIAAITKNLLGEVVTKLQKSLWFSFLFSKIFILKRLESYEIKIRISFQNSDASPTPNKARRGKTKGN